MKYYLFFKTEHLKNNRTWFVREYSSYDKLSDDRMALSDDGFMGERVIDIEFKLLIEEKDNV